MFVLALVSKALCAGDFYMHKAGHRAVKNCDQDCHCDLDWNGLFEL